MIEERKMNKVSKKTKENLLQSRENASELLLKFGDKLPESIMKFNKSESIIDSVASSKKNELQFNFENKSCVGYKKKHETKLLQEGKSLNEAEAFSISSRNNVMSIFPSNIARKLILFYTEEYDIVIDPFAGHNSRMQLCYNLNRHYYGQDVCHEFMQMNEEIKNLLLNQMIKNKVEIVLKEGDSKKLKFEDEIGNFTITSPPYWNIEYYGNEKEQLYFSKTYEDFLNNLQEIMKENYRVLKKGSYCIWFVNDFRKNKKFYSYHSDVINRMKDVGFIQNDIIIVDLGGSIRSIFTSQVFESKIIPKRHEYALIFKKE
jgi:DNA modification methylase